MKTSFSFCNHLSYEYIFTTIMEYQYTIETIPGFRNNLITPEREFIDNLLFEVKNVSDDVARMLIEKMIKKEICRLLILKDKTSRVKQVYRTYITIVSCIRGIRLPKFDDVETFKTLAPQPEIWHCEDCNIAIRKSGKNAHLKTKKHNNHVLRRTHDTP
jgi:hypothetical protein